MIEEALVSRLVADPTVAGLAGDRIFPLLIPQALYAEASRQPCLVYQRTSTDTDATFCETIGLRATQIQIDAYARRYQEARELGRAAREALTDFRGDVSGLHIDRVTLANEFDGLDEEPGLYRRSLTFLVWFTEV